MASTAIPSPRSTASSCLWARAILPR